VIAPPFAARDRADRRVRSRCSPPIVIALLIAAFASG
jgi:hypothetical protein